MLYLYDEHFCNDFWTVGFIFSPAMSGFFSRLAIFPLFSYTECGRVRRLFPLPDDLCSHRLMKALGVCGREKGGIFMKKNNALAFAGMMTALAVVGSFVSFPVLGSKCAPVQHMVNVACAVFLGPWWGVGVAFTASLIRNLLGLGSPLAFPGSMVGALIAGLAYQKLKSLPAAFVGEVLGTGILGALLAYPIAIRVLGVDPSKVVFTAYIVPFLISTVVGSLISMVVIYALQKAKAL